MIKTSFRSEVGVKEFAPAKCDFQHKNSFNQSLHYWNRSNPLFYCRFEDLTTSALMCVCCSICQSDLMASVHLLQLKYDNPLPDQISTFQPFHKKIVVQSKLIDEFYLSVSHSPHKYMDPNAACACLCVVARSSKLREAMRRQTTRGPMIWHQKPNASGNQTQSQWSFAAGSWREVTYGILSQTC